MEVSFLFSKGEAKKFYGTIVNDLNRTSLLFYHYPNTPNGLLLCPTICLHYPKHHPYYHNTRPESLLTGDAQLSDSEWEAVVERLGNQDVAVISVPHHCSDSKYIGWLSIRSDFAIASYGISNTYGHPSKSLIDKISRSRISVALCNEREGFCYTVFS